MKTRWLALGIGLGVLLTLTLGFAYRGTASSTGAFAGPGGDLRQTMEAMHDSPQMRSMHERMPQDLQAQCDALHEQMVSGVTGPGGMMGGSVSGSGMMGGGTAPGSVSGGMMGGGTGPGSVSGGMMGGSGSGSGMMGGSGGMMGS